MNRGGRTLALAACGGDDGAGDGDGDGSIPPPTPPAICDVPATLVDTSAPDHVIGTGTPASCSAADLAAAVTAGGTITFNCGPGARLITLLQPLVSTAGTGCPTIDQRGMPRSEPCTIGAVEAP